MKMKYFFLLAFALLISINSYSQMPPPPVSSPTLNAVMGTWISEPYEMMGMKMVDEASHKMILNGQFMQVDIKANADNGFSYEALGIMAPSTDGTMTGWFYDIFGKGGMMTYSGKAEGNKITISGSNDKMSETREITIDGDKMIHNVIYKMKDASGKMMPDQTATITYRKK